MDKTRVDDLIISMITPKITEIEKKFSDGEGLTQDDINTLLLKSQYNHINHLDDKLNEVTTSVVMLENKFIGLEGKFIGLEGKFEMLKTDLEGKFELLENKFELFKSDMTLQLEKATNKMIASVSIILSLFLALSQFLNYIQ